jgi:hypothetical protein
MTPVRAGFFSRVRRLWLPGVLSAAGNTASFRPNAGDANHDSQITVGEMLTAVNNALNGC